MRIEVEGILKSDETFDIGLTGFETAEIDLLLGAGETPGDDEPEAVIPEGASGPPVSRPGDLWALGCHRLYCGDALDTVSYRTVLDGESARAVFTDPPYNVPIDGHVCGNGEIRHSEFAMASGEMSADEFMAFLRAFCEHLSAFTIDGAIVFICMDWRHAYEILSVGRDVFNALKNVCVWNKTNNGMGSFYRSKHELVFVFKSGTARHVNNIELGRYGRNRTNAWDYAGINSFGKGRLDDLAAHPTVKPVSLIADAIRDVTHRNDLVLDPFVGSGSTILAAERAGRRCAAIELDPKYVDVAVRRYEAQTGVIARHGESGKTFAEVSEARINSVRENKERAS